MFFIKEVSDYVIGVVLEVIFSDIFKFVMFVLILLLRDFFLCILGFKWNLFILLVLFIVI